MLTECYRPVINGITHSVSLCKREMERVGHQVTVFTFGNLDYRDQEERVLRSSGIRIADTGYYFGLEHSQRARRELAEMDILHVHHPFSSGQIALRHGRRLGTPVVFTNHSRYDLYANAYFPSVPPVLIRTAVERYMLSFTADCDLVVAPSRGLRDVAVDWGVESEIVIIPNGIDLDRLYHPADGLSRTDLGIPEEATLLIHTGRFGPEKNLAMLVDAFEQVARAAPDVYLLFVGGGPLEDEIQERAAGLDHVRFAGWVEYDEVPSHLALGDIFCTASVTEVHPLVVIEALAAGLPVVGVHSPGVSDTVRDGVDGYLTTLDLDEFVAAILQMVGDPARRRKMAAHARDQSREYDIRTTASAYLREYERLIRGREG
jgi:glycosyltransferase involved in cell wall biosynthesis